MGLVNYSSLHWPFARPTTEERIEHLLTRVHKKSNVSFGAFALEHTLSFQRRVHAIKADFLYRGRTTPLGVTQDYWDRTEDHVELTFNYECCRCVTHNQSKRFILCAMGRLSSAVLFTVTSSCGFANDVPTTIGQRCLASRGLSAAADPSKGGMNLEEVVCRHRTSTVCNTTHATSWPRWDVSVRRWYVPSSRRGILAATILKV